jgi:protein O-mannosyl-transferase
MATPAMQFIYQATQNKRLQILLISAALIILILIPYWQVKDHDFVNYDDPFHILDSQTLRNGFTMKGIACTFTFCAANKEAPHWHPITWLSLMLDYRLYGLKPAGYHLTNLFLHILNTLILFFVLNHMTRAPWRSAFVAALFAVHPLHVESVAWATERRDVLSTFFGLLTVAGYLYYIRRPTFSTYLPMIVFFSLGLMSKSMIVTLPFVLLLLDYWPLGRFSPVPMPSPEPKVIKKPEFKETGKKRRQPEPIRQTNKHAGDIRRSVPPATLSLFWEKIPLMILSLIASFMTFYFHKSLGGINFEIPLVQRLGNAILSYASYIWKMLWPINLAAFYPYRTPLSAGWVAASAFLLLLLTAAVLYFRKSKPFLLTGWFWYLGTLIPVIGIVQAGEQAMADRHVYIPLVGLFIIVTWAISDLAQKIRKHEVILFSIAAAVTTALTVVTWKQISYWKSSVTLFEHAVSVTSRNYLAHNQLGVLYAAQGRLGDSVVQFDEAVRSKPDYARARVGLGNTLVLQGKFDEAEKQFREAIRIDPHFVESYTDMASLMHTRGKTEEAMAYIQKALTIDPNNPKSFFLLGDIQTKQGKTDNATSQYKKAIELNPQYADAAYNNLGIALRSQGKIPEAIIQFQEALRLNPRNVSARMNLGNIMVSQGQIEEGIRQFREAVQIDPANINALNRLGSALLIQGKTAEAVIQFRKVLVIQPQDATAQQAMRYVEDRMRAASHR